MKKIQLSIPKPCHENWDAMTPSEKGKFCGSCQKTVIDFTEMSDRHIAEFFKKPSTSVCGRFYQNQLHKEIELPKKRIPWIKYFFQIALPAFLVSIKANAQKTTVLMGDTTYCTQTMGFVSSKAIAEKSTEPNVINGQIIDQDGNKIAFATIVIKNSNVGTQSDAEGKFQLQAPLNSKLVFSAVGYRSKEVALNEETKNLLVRFEKDDIALSGVIVVVGYTARKKLKPFPIIQKVIDTAFNKFSVYPNPTHGNSTITIDFMKLEAGNYKISIIGSSGDIIQSDGKEISAKNKIASVFIKDVAAGTYFIHILSQKTGASYSKKIIIQ
jgi:hypothetical protein